MHAQWNLGRRFGVALCLAVSLAGVTHADDTTPLGEIPTSVNLGEKPQSKTWRHADTWWMVAASGTPAGTWIWRLEADRSWTNVLLVSDSTSAQADTKRMGDVTHILLHEGDCELVSVQYAAKTNTYELWGERTTPTPISTGPASETATIDIDSTGKMWLATESITTVVVYHSDPPYTTFDGPIILEDHIKADDISLVVALPNDTVCVLWSNQNDRRFGCRVHVDGDAPGEAFWGEDEVPASQSASGVGLGMADDHLNAAVASDGTMYVAVKTSFDTDDHTNIGLLKRRLEGKGTAGVWDRLYKVDDTLGSRPIVVLNETPTGPGSQGTVRVMYTQFAESPRVIAYKASEAGKIDFGPEQTLIEDDNNLNKVTSSKENWDDELVVLCSRSSVAALSVLLTDYPMGSCCYDGGVCDEIPLNECDDTGGVFQGAASVCSGTNCPLPAGMGSCCLYDAVCENLSEADCATQFGVFDEGINCTTVTCPPPSPCPADANNDLVIDVLDLLMVILNWGTAHPAADLDNSGVVDVQDLILFILAEPGSCLEDCNDNGTHDAFDVADGTSPDCNGNGVPDDCDLADATSQDCNENGLPDECESDCNRNGIPDDCDLAFAFSADCNLNGVPDECDPDFDDDGTPDDCQAADNCQEVTQVCPGTLLVGDTSDATPDGPATCGSAVGVVDVWIGYTPMEDGIAVVSVCDFDSLISIFAGCAQTDESPLICNSGGNCGVIFPVQGGTDYRIRVAGLGVTTGAFTMTLSGPECE